MSRIPCVLCMLGLLSVAAGGVSAPAAVIQNGDFSEPGTPPDPFAGWTTFFGDPPADVGNEYAVFTVVDIELFQLEQTFTLPAGALTLSFEIRLTVESGGTETLGAAPDSFQATLFDLDPDGDPDNPLFPSGDPLLFPAFYSIDSHLVSPQEFYDATFVSVTSLDDGWRKVTLNLSSLPSQDLLLEFVQSGSADGLTSEIWLDNVVVTLQSQDGTVPEPGALAVWVGIFLIGLPWVRRRSLRLRG